MKRLWKRDLERWLAPFLAALRHKTRSRMCPAYVAGLIGAGNRKSIQPMAARDGQVGYDQLHHFIASGVWDAAPLQEVLFVEAGRMVSGDDAWLIIDDTALPKKGERSVGVAPQYASTSCSLKESRSTLRGNPKSQESPLQTPLSCKIDYSPRHLCSSPTGLSPFITGDYIEGIIRDYARDPSVVTRRSSRRRYTRPRSAAPRSGN
jgi:hypothetical protein